VGTTGFAEKEKSQASDSFKRACFNWGIGRELYTAPFIWIPAGKTEIQRKDNRFVCSNHFSVKDIEYNEDREIVGLTVTNEKGMVVYELKAKREMKKTTPKSAITKTQMKSLNAELERTGIAMETVQERYRFQKAETMGEDVYNKVMAALAKTKSVAA